MTKQHSNAAMLFGLMAIQYALLTINTRAITSANYIGLFVTDIVIAWLGFTILKKIVEAQTKMEMIAYCIGGATGAQIALLIGLHVFGAAK